VRVVSEMGDLRLITSAYPGKCRVCKTPHDKGGQVWWRKGEKGVVCWACKPNVAPERVSAPTPSPSMDSWLPPAPTTRRRMIVREFDSWRAYVEKADADKSKTDFCSATDTSRPEWHGTASFKQAKDMALNGWSGIRAEVDALVENIEHAVMPNLAPAFTSYFDVSGGMVDVGRFMDGEPECMVETRLVEMAKPGKVVTVLVQGFYSSASEEDQIKARGAAVVALVDAVEKMQHATEIYVEYTFSKKLCHLVKVKGAGEALDIDTLMFILAHPSAYRRISFGVQEGEPAGLGCGPSGSYGEPNDLTQGERVGASIQLDTLRYDTPTMDSKEWIREQLVNVGLIRGEEGNG
jgi:hypothetical protein